MAGKDRSTAPQHRGAVLPMTMPALKRQSMVTMILMNIIMRVIVNMMLIMNIIINIMMMIMMMIAIVIVIIMVMKGFILGVI